MSKEQKLIDIMFSIALTIHEDEWFKDKDREDVADWVRKKLDSCGFHTVPMGSSWGHLVPRESEIHPDENKEHHVYFIKEKAIFGKDVHLKIGYSKDHRKRLAQLQTGHPNELGLGGLIKCNTRSEAIELEAELHERFKAARKHGEWFYENNHIRAFLASEARSEFEGRYYRCFF